MPTVGPSEPSGVTAGLLSCPWHLAPLPLPLPHFHPTRSYSIVLKAPLRGHCPGSFLDSPPSPKLGKHLLWLLVPPASEHGICYGSQLPSLETTEAGPCPVHF